MLFRPVLNAPESQRRWAPGALLQLSQKADAFILAQHATVSTLDHERLEFELVGVYCPSMVAAGCNVKARRPEGSRGIPLEGRRAPRQTRFQTSDVDNLARLASSEMPRQQPVPGCLRPPGIRTELTAI